MKIYLVAVFVLCPLLLLGQFNIGRSIYVNYHLTPLEAVLENLYAEHGITFSYGFDNISSSTPITINPRAITIAELLEEICRQAGLTYMIIEKIIVFRSLKQDNFTESRIPETSSPASRKTGRSPTQMLSLTELPRPRSILAAPTISYDINTDVLSSQENQKKRRLSQRVFGIAVSPVVDFNFYEYRPRDLDFQYFKHRLNMGIGTSLYFYNGNRFLLKTGVNWASKNFTLHHNYLIFDPTEPVPIPDVTTVHLQYIEIPLNFGYTILRKKFTSIWLTSGVYFLNSSREDEKTSFQNRPQSRTAYFSHANNTKLFSGSLGLAVNQKVISKASLFIEPEFIFYSSSINNEAINSSVTAFRLNAGVAYRMITQ